MENCRYPHPNLINADLALKVIEMIYPKLGDPWEDIYILSVFLKPGKHTMLIQNQQDFTLQSIIVEPRIQPIPHFVKEGKHAQKVRVFKKEDSVFELYREDDKIIE